MYSSHLERHLEELHRLELAVGHYEQALKEASLHAMQFDKGWELVGDLQKGYTRHKAALEKTRQRVHDLTAPRRPKATRAWQTREAVASGR